MGDYWLIVCEIAVALALAILYFSARKAFSAEDIRRTMILENENLSAAIEKLAADLETRAEEACARLKDAVDRADEAARSLERLCAGAQEAASEAIGETAVGGEKHKQVLTLAQRGLPAAAIAREVGLGTGEVELVLNITKEGLKVKRPNEAGNGATDAANQIGGTKNP
jgi:hypothetical protein